MGKTWGQDYWWLIIGNIGWWLSICCFQLMKNWRKHNYRYSQHVTNNQLLSHVVPIVWYWPRPMSISQKCSRGCTRWNEPKNNRVHETTAKRHGLSSIQRARILVNMPALQNGLRLNNWVLPGPEFWLPIYDPWYFVTKKNSRNRKYNHSQSWIRAFFF